MLSTNDLQRVSAEKAAAVLVLCDKFSQEPGKEDLSNIMRVISLKNYSESTRCIIQLLYYSSKVGLKCTKFCVYLKQSLVKIPKKLNRLLWVQN